MRFRLRHPSDRQASASYGWEPDLGFFAHVTNSSGERTYDALDERYDHARPLDGALRFLAKLGFYSADDLEEALGRLQHQRIEEMPKRLRRVAKVVVNMKRAAD